MSLTFPYKYVQFLRFSNDKSTDDDEDDEDSEDEDDEDDESDDTGADDEDDADDPAQNTNGYHFEGDDRDAACRALRDKVEPELVRWAEGLAALLNSLTEAGTYKKAMNLLRGQGRYSEQGWNRVSAALVTPRRQQHTHSA